MSVAIENEMHCTPPELTQIAADFLQHLIPPKCRKVYKIKISKFLRGKIINYYSPI
jgi:hypothetical protein